jgi:hypothetical protein
VSAAGFWVGTARLGALAGDSCVCILPGSIGRLTGDGNVGVGRAGSLDSRGLRRCVRLPA